MLCCRRVVLLGVLMGLCGCRPIGFTAMLVLAVLFALMFTRLILAGLRLATATPSASAATTAAASTARLIVARAAWTLFALGLAAFGLSFVLFGCAFIRLRGIARACEFTSGAVRRAFVTAFSAASTTTTAATLAPARIVARTG